MGEGKFVDVGRASTTKGEDGEGRADSKKTGSHRVGRSSVSQHRSLYLRLAGSLRRECRSPTREFEKEVRTK